MGVESVRQFFQGDAVSFVGGRWIEEVRLRVKGITQWRVKILRLGDNKRVSIVKEIAHIHFTALIGLRLGDNQIQSIEELPQINMPSLQDLILGNNSIASVRVMRKAAWPNLRSLAIRDNYFWDGKFLTEGCFPHLQGLFVYSLWKENNQHIQQCFLAKMQSPSIQHIHVLQSKFSFDRSTLRVLQQKWLHADIS